MKTWYIGIDTGVKTGFAYCLDGKLTNVLTLPIHRAISELNHALSFCIREQSRLHVVVEDARLRRWFGEKGREALQGAGSVKRDAKIWEDCLNDLRGQYPQIVSFEMLPPAANRTKLSKEAFARLTGWKERTSEHGRDAAMLVWGRKGTGFSDGLREGWDGN
ncbi:hypothetical protein HMPREF9123_1121 [Neisseria bacilliformis ATCC BAA-1200]|uniref:Uncharacterized protein n=1 Tax=Neisseria bacilliformis ATCC BAA-1200 TaxID=888742 RepID=F2BBL6_9NEIS|nr:hypothetical protein [Neisseria bacilliformis]EGF11162.1 hypothetical protein HMPREF9123_1121 [Neisseria bacilliformis ATCC BAA-1200]QMT48200.1 hypothetical protein H3L91_03520 [Neisseria bacilliformis]